MVKRIFAVLLVFVMVFSMLPLEAGATQTPTQPADTEQSGGAPTPEPTPTPTPEPTPGPTAEGTGAEQGGSADDPGAGDGGDTGADSAEADSPMLLATAAAPAAEEGYPTDLEDYLYLAIYTGSGFPGEPAWYSFGNYANINSSFKKASFSTFASRAGDVLSPSILDSMVPGTGSGSTKVWGVFSTSGVSQYLTGGGILDPENEAKIIKAVKGSRVNTEDYRIIWYVIKYQTDTKWHIDGLIVEKETYNVNYYGNGNTSGSAPTGATGLHSGDSYTVLGNTGSMKNVRSGFSYDFIGWNTRADGSGTAYAAGQAVSISGDVTLYAQWKTPTRSISITKVWDDGSDQDGLRPDEVTVHLLQNDQHSNKPMTLSAAAGWSGTWYELPALDQFGNEIDYYIEEPALEGYTYTVSGSMSAGFTLTNTHRPETVSLEVQKVWDDDNDRDGRRPDSVTVQLYQNAVAFGSPVELNAAGSWAHSFHGLPRYENGQPISYTVEELSVPASYTVSYGKDSETGRSLVINSRTPETVELKVTKAWDDGDDRDKLRPDSVTVRVYANGSPTDRTVEITAAGGWQATVSGLPKNYNGSGISYSFVEEAPPAGYTVQAQGSAANDYTVTNHHAPAARSISITKLWDDNEDQDNIRPDSVSVSLYADGEKLRDVSLSAGLLWQTTLRDLPVYAQGREIVYTISEAEIEGYSSAISGDMATGFTITNSHAPATLSIQAAKSWNDEDDRLHNRPDSVTVTLYDNGLPTDKTLTLSDANSWTGTWADLPVKRAGQRISYTVVETGYSRFGTDYSGIPGGYTASYSYDETDPKLYKATVYNSYKPTLTSLNVQKVWLDENDQDGRRPDKVTVYLRYDLGDDDSGWVRTTRSRTLNAQGRWEADFTDLPKYAYGAPIRYDVVEEPVEGYEEAEYFLDTDTNVVTVTNRRTPEKLSISVTKLWDDAENNDRLRPDRVTIRLYADGADTGRSLTLEGDRLSGSFTGLNKYRRGVEIVYTIAEDAVPGYSSAVTGSAAEGFTVVNRHEPEKLTIPVTKLWDDNKDNDGKRPSDVTLVLMNGSTQAASLSLDSSSNWRGLFTGIPKYDKGVEISYSLEEVSVPGYSSVITGSASEGYTVTNTHEPETTNVTVSKYWQDNDDQDGLRPDSATFHLMAFGEHMGEEYRCTLTAADIQSDGAWSHTWQALPKYKEGLLINYTVYEQTAEQDKGYAAHYDRIGNHVKVTNVREPDKLSFTVQKVWDDASDQDKLRPASIDLQLMAGDELIGEPVTLTAEGHWRHTWTDLDRNKDGDPIPYRLRELSSCEGYGEPEIAVDQDTGVVTVTNRHIPYTTRVSVSKIWEDEHDRDGKRPDSVTVTLYQNGVATDKTAQLNSANGWSFTWEELPVHHGVGLKNVYSVVEAPTEGYTCQLSGTQAQGFTLTNTHIPETVDIPVTKLWDDNKDQDGLRPESTTLTLYADGAAADTVLTLSASENWTGTLTGLPKYADGREIVYSLKELDVPTGYTASGDASADNDYTITNSHTPKLIAINAVKLWEDGDDNDGKRPWQIELSLLDNGLPIEGLDPLLLNASNGWQGQWPDMPRYRGGRYVDYTVIETAWWQSEGGQRIAGLPKGYTATHSYSERSPEAIEATATVTNRYTPETIGINVQKVWDDDNNRDRLRPESITVWLWYKLPDTDTWVKTQRSAVMSPANEWDVDFTGLQKLYKGRPIVYNVAEEPVEGYTASYALDTTLSLVTITNTHVPAVTTVSVSKVWEDNNDQDGKRPDSIAVDLYANGIIHTGDVVLSAGGGWKHEFKDLPLNSNGTPIVYRVYEDPAQGYTVSYSGSKNTAGTEIDISLTNTHIPEKIDIPVSKVWVDNNDQDGLRPHEISLTLYKGGEAAGSLTLTDSENWSGSFRGLDRYENGAEIVYTLRESVPTGYSVEISGSAAEGFTVTNTHIPAATSLTAVKVWDDDGDRDGRRPDSITLHLVSNGSHMGESCKRVLTEADAQPDGTWLCKWEDLPKYAGGRPIDYTVYEEPVLLKVSTLEQGPSAQTIDRYEPDYSYDSANDIVTITNSYTPQVVEITAHKVWVDGDDRDALRPCAAAARLCRVDNGVLTAIDEQSLSPQNNWTFQWQLPRYENGGSEIVYTVIEPNTYKGYVNSVRQEVDVDPGFFILTSLHEPATTGVSVEKIWSDEEDNDGKRPDGIIVQLYADGEPLANGRVVLSVNNNWSVSWQSSTQYPLYVYEKGELISYSVEELGYVLDGVEYPGLPEGYEDDYSGDSANRYALSITNSRVSEKISIDIEKVWDDDDDNDGKRPGEITLTLVKNGQAFGDKLTLSAATGWKISVPGLLRYTGGVVNDYSVVEDVPEGYTASYAASSDSKGNISITVTNSHISEVGHYTMKKVWLDGGDRDGRRPDSVSIQLYKNGLPYGEPVTLSEADNWQKSCQLPMYDDGQAILWTVRERFVPLGYSVYYEQDTLTVINSTTPKTGDKLSLGPWLIMMSLSGLMCTACALTLKRKRSKPTGG